MKISRVILVSLAVLVAGVLWFVFLAGSTDYSDADIREVNRAELFAITEQLLAESESWPPELEADQVSVSSLMYSTTSSKSASTSTEYRTVRTG